jgi:hypothetical protein
MAPRAAFILSGEYLRGAATMTMTMRRQSPCYMLVCRKNM